MSKRSIKTITLNKWIEETGRSVVAKKLGVTITAVGNWCVGYSTPKDSLKLKIYELSKGRVTYESMIANNK